MTGRNGGSPRALQLDHIFCMVEPDEPWVQLLERAGWLLDRGSRHPGQGTSNRRVCWAEQYLELLWVHDVTEARTNALRLDRRAAWRETGASPFGVCLRGSPQASTLAVFRAYDELGFRLWIHCDNWDRPERPMLFIHPATPAEVAELQPQHRMQATVHRDRHLAGVRLIGPEPVRLPEHSDPVVHQQLGSPQLQIRLTAGRNVQVHELLELSAPGAD
jgi:hypothetical protein